MRWYLASSFSLGGRWDMVCGTPTVNGASSQDVTAAAAAAAVGMMLILG